MSRLWMRDQRGIALPSPVVLLSIVAVAMAAIAFVATRGHGDGERKVIRAAAVSSAAPTPSAAAGSSAPATSSAALSPKPKTVKRGKVYVEVFNNSRVHGLAAKVGSRVSKVGWNVVGTDNWYGSISTTTVYYPKRLKAAAKQLALDLGIRRTAPAIDPMKMDRLTLILTGPLS